MPSKLAGHAGIFLPEEIDEMRTQLEAGAQPGETPERREDRATAIIQRYRVTKQDGEPPLP